MKKSPESNDLHLKYMILAIKSYFYDEPNKIKHNG